MNKTIFVLGMLVVFAFTPFNVETAKADVDISGQCANFAPPIIGDSITPDIICKARGFYGCVAAGGMMNEFNARGCGGGGVSGPVHGSCVWNLISGLPMQSARVDTLVCEDIRPWGVVPRPGNVPSDFNQTILNLTN